MAFCFRLLFLLLLILPGITEARTDPSDKNEVIVAVPSDFPPHYSVGENGKPEGFAIDVMDKIGKENSL